jgi:molybdenum cofactor cytidylyltransferase
MASWQIVPIVLAAGGSGRLGSLKPLALFGGRTALSIAVENCKGLARPIVVLGCDAGKIRPAVPGGARVVMNRGWRKGQLSSLLRALGNVPAGSAFMIYPVDQPLLQPETIVRLVQAFRARPAGKAIVMPTYRGEDGHPVLLAAELQPEFRSARTPRDVIFRRPARILRVAVRTPAVIVDFDSPESYHNCVRKYRARK